MRNKLILLIAFLLIPSAFAISTDIKPVYAPGETLIIEIAGNILEPIEFQNIELKRNNVQVPWEYDVKRLGDRYYLYGILPSVENNYTLYIRDITTTLDGRVTKIDYNQSFSTSGQLASYSIKPGFIIAQESFEFEMFLNRDFPEPIMVNFPEEHESILQPGENTLGFTTTGIEPGFIIIQIGIYSIPVLIIETQGEIPALPDLRFFPRNIESTILFNEVPIYPFSIINSGAFEIAGLELEYNPEIFIIEPVVNLIGSEETIGFNLSLKKMNEPIQETIILRSGDLLIEFPIDIGYTENIGEVETPYLDADYLETQGYFCSELGGKACAAGEVCSITSINSIDVASCCTGICLTAKSDSGSLAWIGYSIAAVILIILVIIGGRYLKSKKQKGNPLMKKLEKTEKKKLFTLS